MIRWWLPPEQRQEKKKRNPYRWGVKNYLSSFVIGEERTISEEFCWNSIKSMASRMRLDYGCQFKCSFKIGGPKLIKRIA